jgi:hypothetical protein
LPSSFLLPQVAPEASRKLLSGLVMEEKPLAGHCAWLKCPDPVLLISEQEASFLACDRVSS